MPEDRVLHLASESLVFRKKLVTDAGMLRQQNYSRAVDRHGTMVPLVRHGSSYMVVIVEKQVYGGPWTKGDNTCGLKVLSGAPEVIRTPGLLIRSSK
jgi:hypothetical protein